MQGWGDEEYCCALTGRVFKARVFVGFVFYEVLRHLADRKVQARGPRGPVQPLTYQPTEGKRLKGGLRIGEMERDAFMSHGAARLYNDLTVHNSDRATLHFCRRCGQSACAPPGWDPTSLVRCGNKLCESQDVVPIKSTWCFNLLMAELKALNLNIVATIEQQHGSETSKRLLGNCADQLPDDSAHNVLPTLREDEEREEDEEDDEDDEDDEDEQHADGKDDDIDDAEVEVEAEVEAEVEQPVGARCVQRKRKSMHAADHDHDHDHLHQRMRRVSRALEVQLRRLEQCDDGSSKHVLVG